MGDFIRKGDKRVKRRKNSKNIYEYYLAKDEDFLDIIEETPKSNKKKASETYNERDLHKLLSTFLNNFNVYSKTIFHEQSKLGEDSNQRWIHPDMIGIQFSKLKSETCQNLLKTTQKNEAFKLSSYELKKEINSDAELKKAYFQAFSNSNWANYGYLVVFELNENLMNEIERLNQSFGIGVIKLKPNPYESQILFPAKAKDLDFRTMDKLCHINKEFEMFIGIVDKFLTAEARYINSTEIELSSFCDKYFETDDEIEEYCKEKHLYLKD